MQWYCNASGDRIAVILQQHRLWSCSITATP